MEECTFIRVVWRTLSTTKTMHLRAYCSPATMLDPTPSRADVRSTAMAAAPPRGEKEKCIYHLFFQI